MVNRFILNEVSYFGPGARKELPGVVARLGFKKALVVTDKGLMQFGVAKMVLDVMDQAGIEYEIFDDVKPNPTVTNVKNGIEACKKAGADFIVAIGGGSSMDTAKGIGIVVNNPEFSDIISLEGVADTKKMSRPTISKENAMNSYSVPVENTHMADNIGTPSDSPLMGREDVYDLNGLRVQEFKGSSINGKPSEVNGKLRKGIYIINGKKVLIRSFSHLLIRNPKKYGKV